MNWTSEQGKAAVIAATLAVGLMAAVAAAEKPTAGEKNSIGVDWPRLHGPDGDGRSPITGIRKDWTGGLKKVWEVKDLSPDCSNWSPPSIQGNRLIVLGQHANPAGQTGNTDTVFCFDADKGGAPLWKSEFQDGYDDYGWGTGPVAAPAIDNDKVFVAGRDGTLLCLSMLDGKIVWKSKDGQNCRNSGHGYNASPLVWDDLLIVAGLSHINWQNSLVGAVKKDTGQFVWAYDKAGQPAAPGPAYEQVSPIRMKLNGKDQVVWSSRKLVCGIDSRTGKPLWEHEIEKWGGEEAIVASVPVGEWPFFYASGLNALPIGLQYEESGTKELWRGLRGKKAKYAPGFNQAIVINGYAYDFACSAEGARPWLFGAGPDGYLICVDLKTGDVKWEDKTGNGNMILVDGCLLCLTQDGDLLLVNPSPDGFKKITEWKGAITQHPWMYKGKDYSPGGKQGAPCWVGPVVARGKLYLRYDDTLSCYQLTATGK